MPELPEVETVRRGLSVKLLPGAVVREVLLRRRTLRVPIPAAVVRELKGQTIHNIRRRAKYLLLDIGEHTLISHLGMSGSWRINEAAVPIEYLKHDHVSLRLADGREVIFHDPRRFGLLLLSKHQQEGSNKWLKNLGIEPLEDNWSAADLQRLAKDKSVNIKTFIMNQAVIVGVGNIYASEALFRAQIRPARKVRTLKVSEWQALALAIREVLQFAIDFGGTTLKDYRNADGGNGEFKQRLQVYDRAKLPCRGCAELIVQKTIQGRSTYWCKVCQR